MNSYAIRQAIVSAMHKLENPQTFETVLRRSEIVLAVRKASFTNDDIREIRREWNFLIEHGYLNRVSGWDDYAKLSGDLRSRLDATDPLTGLNPLRNDELIYGADALR